MPDRIHSSSHASTSTPASVGGGEPGHSGAPGKPPAGDPRDPSILLAKGLAIVGVVAHHLANRRFSPENRDWIAALGNATLWAVPLFLLVSGYLHGKSRFRKRQGFLEFASARARRLLLPYLVFSLLYAVVYSVLLQAGYLGDVGHGPYQWYEYFRDSLTMEGGIGEQLYFLPLLFVVSAGGFGLLALVHWSGRRSFLLATTLLVTSLLCPQWFASLPGRMVWPWREYAAGVAVYVLGFILATRPWLKREFFAVTSLVVLAAATARHDLAMQSLFPIALLCGLQIAGVRSRPLEQVGDAAGTIFLYHTPFFLPPLLVVIATKMPERFQILAAYGAGIVTIIFFTAVHFALRRSRFKWLSF